MATGLEKTQNLAGYRCQTLYYDAVGTPIVFLHGLSYNVEVWQRIGITEALMEKHVPFLALDMPYGIKSNCQPRTRSPQKNVAYVNEAVKTVLGGTTPIIVGASIGGHMALQYAMQFPVKGLLLIAPGRTLDPEMVESYRQFKFPTTIIWGSEDNIVPSEDMRVLADKLPNAKLIVYNGASHSAYKDQPQRFRIDLLSLYAAAE